MINKGLGGSREVRSKMCFTDIQKIGFSFCNGLKNWKFEFFPGFMAKKAPNCLSMGEEEELKLLAYCIS